MDPWVGLFGPWVLVILVAYLVPGSLREDFAYRRRMMAAEAAERAEGDADDED